MAEPTLLIMAAGMGTRYGGLKQIDPVGPNGEIIFDYAIYDAIRAGFKKLVFVIRHCFEDAFREKIGSKFDGIAQTVYAYQELDECLGSFKPPADREKPWGTAHAIVVAKDLIDEPFAVINSDDYYGPTAFEELSKYLSSDMTDGDGSSMIGYILRNTLSDYGFVSRGVCRCDGDMFLKEITEIKKIKKLDKGAISINDDGTEKTFNGGEIVSMNLWGFPPKLFEHLEKRFQQFLKDFGSDNKAELYIPTVVNDIVQSGQAKVKVLPTTDRWFGITYREDRDIAVGCVNKLIEQGVYPKKLW